MTSSNENNTINDKNTDKRPSRRELLRVIIKIRFIINLQEVQDDVLESSNFKTLSDEEI